MLCLRIVAMLGLLPLASTEFYDWNLNRHNVTMPPAAALTARDFASDASMSGPIAYTSLGPILGIRYAGVKQFRGIPHSWAPFRFSLSYPWAAAWGPSTYDATYYRPACVQPVPAPGWETYKGQYLSLIHI